MANKTKIAPELRFAGFTEVWEQRKLLDLLYQPVTDGPHETPNLVENGVPFISVDAIVDNKIDFSRVRGYITEDYDIECSKKYKPQLHDVYMVKSGSTTGKVAIVETTDRFNIWSPLAAMRCGDVTDPYFLYFLLQTDEIQNQVFDKASHGTQPNLSMRQLEKFDVVVPNSIDEQVHLGMVFKSLDHLIALHQRKYDGLLLFKKSMLQKMFPKDGETKPEIRFVGFTDAWEQRKLSEIAEKVTQKNTEMKYKETLTNSAEHGIINQMDFFDKEISNADKIDGYYIVDHDDFVYNPRISTLAPVGPINRNRLNRSGVMSPLYTVFRSHDINTLYLEWFFKSDAWHNFMIFNGDSGARSDRFSIRNDLFFTMPISVPSKEEQTLIGTFFDHLDATITLHQRKLEQLKTIKQFLLQKMFV